MLRKATAAHRRKQEHPTQHCHSPRKQLPSIQKVIGEHKGNHKERHRPKHHEGLIPAHIPASPRIEAMKMENQQGQQRPDHGVTSHKITKMLRKLSRLRRLEDIHIEKVPGQERKDQRCFNRDHVCSYAH